MYFKYFNYFHIGYRSDVVIYHEIDCLFSFLGRWTNWYKRSHEETASNTPHKPAQKKGGEIEGTQEESPVRRSLGFLERLSPAQKVISLMNNLCSMYTRPFVAFWKSVILALIKFPEFFLFSYFRRGWCDRQEVPNRCHQPLRAYGILRNETKRNEMKRNESKRINMY